MNDPSAIPAATVQDVDLSAADPVLSAEILRLGELMELGEETPEQFADLIRLLVRADHPQKAEFLLRRNLEVVADGPGLYQELFGTIRPDEFAAAVESFRRQFEVELEFVNSRGFLDALYRVQTGPRRSDLLQWVAEPCEVQMDYSEPDAVVADVCNKSSEEYLLLRWVGGAWEPVQDG